MLNTRIGENYNANDVINSNDLRKRILNVDSRFRNNQKDLSTDFSLRLAHPYKNVIRIRVASVEIPNTFYVFSSRKKNTVFKVKTTDITGISRILVVTVPDGNYTSSELIDLIQEQFDTNFKNPYGIFLEISLNPNNGKITITHNGLAVYPVTTSSTPPTASAKTTIIDFLGDMCLKSRDTHFGLGYNLGYRSKGYKLVPTTPVAPSTISTLSLTAEGCIDVVGDTYMFLAVNDLYAVEQKTKDNYIQVLAKVIIREDKFAVIYDDGGTLLSNEVIFPSPTDIALLNVQLLDPYGDVIDLCGENFSFSLEITEVLNTRLYDFYRNYIWLGTIPEVNYKKVTGSAQPLLRGVGPPF